MDFLGKGEECFEKQWHKKIDPKKYYPYELRSAIHKAALDQFGEIALVVSGFTAGEIYQDVEEGVAKIYETIGYICNLVIENRIKKAIEKVFQGLRDQSRRFTQTR